MNIFLPLATFYSGLFVRAWWINDFTQIHCDKVAYHDNALSSNYIKRGYIYLKLILLLFPYIDWMWLEEEIKSHMIARSFQLLRSFYSYLFCLDFLIPYEREINQCPILYTNDVLWICILYKVVGRKQSQKSIFSKKEIHSPFTIWAPKPENEFYLILCAERIQFFSGSKLKRDTT